MLELHYPTLTKTILKRQYPGKPTLKVAFGNGNGAIFENSAKLRFPLRDVTMAKTSKQNGNLGENPGNEVDKTNKLPSSPTPGTTVYFILGILRTDLWSVSAALSNRTKVISGYIPLPNFFLGILRIKVFEGRSYAGRVYKKQLQHEFFTEKTWRLATRSTNFFQAKVSLVQFSRVLLLMGAIHSTKISGNFGPKLNGSVRSNRTEFRKNRSTFWGGPLSPVGPVWILVEWIAPNISVIKLTYCK